jgi:Ca-activated chloride channel family protein
VTFGWPLALVGLVLVPVLVGLYVWHDRRRDRVAARFANPALLTNVIDHSPGRLRFVPVVLLFIALAAMIVGVARPHAKVNVPREEATVVLALDVSRAMKATTSSAARRCRVRRCFSPRCRRSSASESSRSRPAPSPCLPPDQIASAAPTRRDCEDQRSRRG